MLLIPTCNRIAQTSYKTSSTATNSCFTAQYLHAPIKDEQVTVSRLLGTLRVHGSGSSFERCKYIEKIYSIADFIVLCFFALIVGQCCPSYYLSIWLSDRWRLSGAPFPWLQSVQSVRARIPVRRNLPTRRNLRSRVIDMFTNRTLHLPGTSSFLDSQV